MSEEGRKYSLQAETYDQEHRVQPIYTPRQK